MPRRVPRAERVHGEVEGKKARTFAAVWALVRRIPRGRVMTYGQIAVLLESRLSPRAVGWAMHGSPKDVPWQRVVNADGVRVIPASNVLKHHFWIGEEESARVLKAA